MSLKPAHGAHRWPARVLVEVYLVLLCCQQNTVTLVFRLETLTKEAIASFSIGSSTLARGASLSSRWEGHTIDPPLCYLISTQNEHLDALLTRLMAGKHGNELSRTSLVTWRGMMTKLCTAIFTKQERYPSAWAMNVMLVSNSAASLSLASAHSLPYSTQVGSTLFIEEHVTAASLTRKAEQQADERQKKMQYFGQCACMLLLSCHAHPPTSALPQDTRLSSTAVSQTQLLLLCPTRRKAGVAMSTPTSSGAKWCELNWANNGS